jgi:hypothetical protein
MRKQAAIVVTACSLVFGLAGCGRGGGGKTPEESFKAFQEAAKAEDLSAAYPHLTKDSQAAMTGGLVMVVSFAKFGLKEEAIKELDEMLKRHGLTEDKVKEKAKADGANKDGVKTMIAMGNLVSDQKGFASDVNKFMKKHSKGERDNPLGKIEKATLSDVKTEGDTAKGKVTIDSKTEEIHFRREGGSWKIDMLPLMEKKSR